MLTVEINNRKHNEFISISVTTALDIFARSFSFIMSPEVFYNSEANTGSAVKIFADNKLILTGFIGSFNNSYSKKNHTVIVSGRSKTADLIDSTIGANVSFQGKISLKTVAKKLAFELLRQPLIPTELPEELLTLNVVVEDDIDDYQDNESLDEELGQTYFEVLEKFARKRQVLLTDNEFGDIVFTRGHGKTSGKSRFVLQNIINGSNNNVIKGFFSQDESKLFNLYDAESQPSKGIITRIKTLGSDGLISGGGVALDERIRYSRKFVFITENSSTSSECTKRARWEANIRQARSTTYTATTSGHSFRGIPWKHNELVSMNDEKVRVRANFLINSVNFNQTTKGGSTTTLTCVLPSSYNIQR
jgi:prophage tail gpP-like protein